jgi:hypothetical protein
MCYRLRHSDDIELLFRNGVQMTDHLASHMEDSVLNGKSFILCD